MKKVLPYSRQAIDQSDINSVIKVLKSDFLTQGPKVVDFEKKLLHLAQIKLQHLQIYTEHQNWHLISFLPPQTTILANKIYLSQLLGMEMLWAPEVL